MVIAFDTETFLIERFRPFPPVVCLSYGYGNHPTIPDCDGVLHHTEAYKWLRHWLESGESFVGHNVAYDFGCAAATWPDLLPLIFDAYRQGRVTDTQLRAQLIDIAIGRVLTDDKLRIYGLNVLYKHTLGCDMPGPGKGDSWRLRYGELYNVPLADWPADAVEYSLCDARATLEIYDAQEAKAAPLLVDDAFQAYSYFCLALTAAQGMVTNGPRVADFERQQRAVMALLAPELQALGLLEPKMRGRKPNKVIVGWTLKQAPARERIAAACAARGVEPLMTEDKRKVKTTEFVPRVAYNRTACHWSQDPVMLRRADYVTADKMVGTYAPPLAMGAEGPITGRFALAATGRTTSSAPSWDNVGPAFGMNMQNAPRFCSRVREAHEYTNASDGPLIRSEIGVRECFQARPAKIYLSGDFSGAEMHALAQACKTFLGYSVLGDVLLAGKDPHLYLACFLLGGDARDYHDVAARYKAGDLAVEKARQDAKPANFGFGGAMGIRRFILTQLKYGDVWDEKRAKALKRAWLGAFPEMQAYFDLCKTELGPDAKCTIKLLGNGRYRRVRGLSTICNSFFQALVADGSKAAINEVIRLCYVGAGPLRHAQARPVNFIHDELIVEMDDSPHYGANHEAAMLFKSALEAEFNKFVPDYPTTVDAVLSYTLSKRMKPVFNNEGLLVPWQA